MALIRWEPAAELGTIQNEVNRLFTSFFDQPGAEGGGSRAGRRWIPAMDLVETADQYVLRADLPGVSDEDVTVQLEDNVLTISGERASEGQEQKQNEGYRHLERAFGAFSRSLTLPAGVNPEGVEAHFDRGVLEVRIPKPERKKPRRVQINTGARSREPETIEGSSQTAELTADKREPALA